MSLTFVSFFWFFLGRGQVWRRRKNVISLWSAAYKTRFSVSLTSKLLLKSSEFEALRVLLIILMLLKRASVA